MSWSACTAILKLKLGEGALPERPNYTAPPRAPRARRWHNENSGLEFEADATGKAMIGEVLTTEDGVIVEEHRSSSAERS